MSAETASGNKVIAMALNNSESLLIALTDTLQIMSLTLKGATSKNNKGKIIFTNFLKNLCMHNVISILKFMKRIIFLFLVLPDTHSLSNKCNFLARGHP